MSTGIVQTPSITVFRHERTESNNYTFNTGADIVEGQPVVLSASTTVSPSAPGNQLVIGVARTSVLSGEKVNITLSLTCIQQTVTMTGGAATNAQLVVSDGTVDADGVVNYRAAASTEYATGIVFQTGAQDTRILIGILHTPILIP